MSIDTFKQVLAEVSHRVSVTVTDPNHTMVTMRKVKIAKRARVLGGTPQQAVERAKKLYRKRGYKVHDASHIGHASVEIAGSSKESHHSFLTRSGYRHTGSQYHGSSSEHLGIGGSVIHTFEHDDMATKDHVKELGKHLRAHGFHKYTSGGTSPTKGYWRDRSARKQVHLHDQYTDPAKGTGHKVTLTHYQEGF